MLVKDFDFGLLDFIDNTNIRLDDDVKALIIDDTKVIIKWVSGSTEVFPLHQIKAIHWSGGTAL